MRGEGWELGEVDGASRLVLEREKPKGDVWPLDAPRVSIFLHLCLSMTTPGFGVKIGILGVRNTLMMSEICPR